MPRKPNWQDLNRRILQRLDLREEFAALGIEIVGSEPSAEGWIACRAIGRQDSNPSAGVNLTTGRYRDHGGDGLSLSLWDLAVHVGRFRTWQEARADYAARAGVELNGQCRDPAEHLEFRPWSDALATLWCARKPGITVDALHAAGARLARYRRQYTVIALPVWGPQLDAADPIGWVLFNTTGGPLPVFHRGGRTSQAKMKTTGGSRSGLIGLAGLRELAREDVDPTSQTIWKVEGPSDLMALWAAISPENRETDLVIANAGGANERPPEWAAGLVAARRVNVVHDADQPGQTGAIRWATWAHEAGAIQVRNVQLPGPVAETHGRDLRDWLGDGHDFGALCRLAADTELFVPAANAEAALAKIVEADDDPHRLARVYIDRQARDAEGRLLLRYWRDEWWRWRDGRYCSLAEYDLRAALTEAIKAEFDRLFLAALEDDRDVEHVRKVTRALTNNVLEALRSLCRVEGVDEQPAWLSATRPTGTNCIAMANGILDMDALLADRELDEVLLPLTPDWFSSVKLDYGFDLDATCPTWERVTAQNLDGDIDRIHLLQEWAGYLLLRETGEQTFLILEGEGGNGKSVFLAGLEAILGGDNVCAVPLELFGQRFALTSTLGKLANLIPDCGEIDKLAEGFLKPYVCGERMQFDRKGKPPIEARPTARLTIAINTRPRVADKSSGVFRRMKIVMFNREVPAAERIKGMDKPEWWANCGEAPGMLLWAIRGLARLREQGGFTDPESSRMAIDEYREENNPARAYLREHCVPQAGERIPSKDLYAAYREWCKDSGYHPLGERMFGKEVVRTFPTTTKCQARILGKRTWCYQHLDWVENLGDLHCDTW